MSVPGREKPANRRQGWRDRSGQGIKTASYPVKGLGIYSAGKDIFYRGPQPFLTIFKSFHMYLILYAKDITCYILHYTGSHLRL